MFGYVRGLVMNFPSITKEQAINLFLNEFNLSEEEISMGTAIQSYNRMVKEYIDLQKSTPNQGATPKPFPLK